MRKHVLITVIAVLLAVLLVQSASAVTVSVRIEGKTRTLFGTTEPRLEIASSALDALVAAATAGEIYYHLASTAYGSYIDQIGLYPAAGASGWMFKVNGAQPPAAADTIPLRDGDRVLWYWADSDPVTFAGPKTLELEPSALTRAERRLQKRKHAKLYCYSVSAQDDKGVAGPAGGALLHIGSKRIARMKNGRACVGPHRGLLVRATLAGAVRSNSLA
jgi:hypothetical protein